MRITEEECAQKIKEGFEEFYTALSQLLELFGRERAQKGTRTLALNQALEYFLDPSHIQGNHMEAFDGHEQMEQLRMLCMGIMNDTMQWPQQVAEDATHPFRPQAQAYMKANPLAGYGIETKARLYSAALNMDYMKSMLPRFIEAAYGFLEKGAYSAGQDDIQALLTPCLCGAAYHLLESLAYQDEPSGRRIFEIIREEKLI